MRPSASNNKPIILTFLDADDHNWTEVDRKLREEGFNTRQLPSQEQAADSLAEVPFAAVLIFRHFDQNRIDKALQSTRNYISKNGGNSNHLICCGEDLLRDDVTKLREWGANKVIQPESW